MKQRVALFDYDNTVASGDSITRLLIYDIKKRPYHIFRFIKVAIVYFLYLVHLSTFEKAKSAILFPLDVMDEKELQTFFKQHAEIYHYHNVVEEMRQKKEEGYIVVLCTASVEAYMKYNELPIHKLIGTKTKKLNNHETSTVIGKNCKKAEKINRIHDFFNEQNIEIDYENSYGYSDSNDDIPMLSLVKHKKRVLLKTGEIVKFVE